MDGWNRRSPGGVGVYPRAAGRTRRPPDDDVVLVALLVVRDDMNNLFSRAHLAAECDDVTAVLLTQAVPSGERAT